MTHKKNEFSVQEIATNNSTTCEITHPASCCGARHAQILILFIMFSLQCGSRVALSVGIVAMTDPIVNPNSTIPTYVWDNKGIILSSFYWGYVLPQFGAGQLAKVYGPKWFLAGSMLINSIFSILIPFMAELGSWGVIACRIIQGLAQGCVVPCVHNMLSKWVPPNERARMGSYVYAGGSSSGTFVAMMVTGWLANSSLGWPSAFYLYGVAGIVCTCAWVYLGKNSPSDHKTMDEFERKYIEISLGQVGNKIIPPTPWKAILTSLPVWAIIIATSGEIWGFTTLLTNTPTYMAGVLNFDIASNGLLSAGPYFVFWLSSFFYSAVIDCMIAKRIVSVGVGRKIANSVGIYIPGIALLTIAILSSYENDNTTVTLVLYFVTVGVNSCAYCGFNVNHIDLSPNHAGTIMGITNGSGCIFAILGPLAVQYMVIDEKDPQQWAVVFYVAAGIYFFTNTFYILFGSGKIQSWNSELDEDNFIQAGEEKSDKHQTCY